MATTPPRYRTRAQWGARRRGATTRSHPLRRPEGVYLHWEGPHMGAFPHSACAGKVRGIERFHRDGAGWADIAYSLLVCPHGYIYEGRGLGVRTAANGTDYANATGYAVCYLGGEGDPFTPDAQAAFVEAVLWLRERGGAGDAVRGHRDAKATSCPGDTIYRWLRGQRFTREDKPMNRVQTAVVEHLVPAIKLLEGTPRSRVVVRAQLAILRRVVAVLRRTDPR